jgi:molybdenum cofactor biosynthesis enzyme MoaA
MNIQSISIVVPTRKCVNNCKFCVSKMHNNVAEGDDGFNKFNITKRIKYAQANGITSCIITGTGEPLQNREFLIKLKELFKELNHPFPNVELQTTGILLTLNQNNKFINLDLLRELGVNTISLSVSSIFEDDDNMEIIGMPKKEHYKLIERIFWLKLNEFNVRLSVNMTNELEKYSTKKIFERIKELNPDQLTFREFWYDNNLSHLNETKWVIENAVSDAKIEKIKQYISLHGEKLYKLPYGFDVYSIEGMSTIIDDDCMAKENDEYSLKYVVLQPDGKLYCRWDDPGSLIF